MPRLIRLAPAALLAGAVMLAGLPGRAEAQALQEAAAPPAAPLTLGYEIYAGGLHVFSVDTEVAWRPERYDVGMTLRTDGYLAWMLEWSSRSRVSGAAEPAGLRPERYRTESSWKGKPRWVELTYDAAAAAPRVEAEPKPEEDNRDPVPPDLQAGTIDPLSAGLGLVHALMNGGRCDGAAAVFDGRRRFDAAAEDAGTAEVPISDLAPFGGEVIACRLKVVPVTGFWRDQRYNARPQDIVVYLRPVVDGQPPVPVRIEADSRFGAVRVHLVSVASNGIEQKADRSR